jgi:hypothetical protein
LVCVWDLRRWLSADLWEADDGPSRRSLCPRGCRWDVPKCWVGENLLAISGIGSDDEAMLDGVRIFDVTNRYGGGRFRRPGRRRCGPAARHAPWELPRFCCQPRAPGRWWP